MARVIVSTTKIHVTKPGIAPSGMTPPSGIVYPDGEMLSYTEVGNDVAVDVDGTLEEIDKSLTDGDPGQSDFKTVRTRYKCGFRNSNWHVGIKNRETEYQGRMKIDSLVYSVDGTNWVEVESIGVGQQDLMDDLGVAPCFTYGDVQLGPKNSGLEAKHRIYSTILDVIPAEALYVGTKWIAQDQDIFQFIERDHVQDTYFHQSGEELVEYFSVDYFHKQDTDGGYTGDLMAHYDHNYTSKSGSMGADETWVAGTYFLTDFFRTEQWTLTLNAAAGDIIIKIDAGQLYAIACDGDSTGQIVSSNTSLTNKIIFTSHHDDSRGESIAGSTGSPAIGDIAIYVLANYGVGSDVTISYVEAHYVGSTSGVFSILNSADQTGSHNSFDNVKITNCTLSLNGNGYLHSFIGQYRYNKQVGNVTVTNCSVDGTNTVGDTTTVNCSRWTKIQSGTFTGNRFTPTGRFGYGIFFQSQKISTYQVLENAVVGDFFEGIHIIANRGGALRHNLYRNTVASTNSTDVVKCISLTRSGITTFSAYVKDNVMTGASFTGSFGMWKSGTMTLVYNNNGYFNNDTDNSEGLGAGDFVADPSYVLLSTIGGVEVEPFVGYANYISNLAGYQYNGSADFDTLGVDENAYSPTGYEYAGTDVYTPGVPVPIASFGADLIGDWDSDGATCIYAPNAWSRGNGNADDQTGNFPCYPTGAYPAAYVGVSPGGGYFENSGSGYLNFDGWYDGLSGVYPVVLTNASDWTIEIVADFTDSIAANNWLYMQEDDLQNRILTYYAADDTLKILYESADVDQDTNTTDTLATGRHIIHFKKEGSDITIWIDGAEASAYTTQDAYTLGTYVLTASPQLGRRNDGTGGFNNKIYWYAMYEKALSPTVIAANAALGPAMGLFGVNTDDSMAFQTSYTPGGGGGASIRRRIRNVMLDRLGGL